MYNDTAQKKLKLLILRRKNTTPKKLPGAGPKRNSGTTPKLTYPRLLTHVKHLARICLRVKKKNRFVYKPTKESVAAVLFIFSSYIPLNALYSVIKERDRPWHHSYRFTADSRWNYIGATTSPQPTSR